MEQGLEVQKPNQMIEQSSDAMARAEAEVKSRMIMALKFPRNESESLSKVLKSCDRPEFAEKAFYVIPRGNGTITGLSVNLAREFARYWRHIDYGFSVLVDNDDSVILEGYAWDMETNTRIREQVSLKKLIKRGGKMIIPNNQELMELINANGAKASRNCLLKLFPRDMLDLAFETAKKSVKKDVSKESLDVTRAKALKQFSEYAISAESLADYIGIPSDQWGEEEIVKLRGIFSALKDGQIKAADIKNPPKEREESEPVEINSIFETMKVQDQEKR